MGIRPVGPIDFRVFFPATQAISVIAAIYMESDLNAISPVLMMTDDTYLYGLYTDSDGTTLRMNDPYNSDPAASSCGTLTVGAFKRVGFTRSSAGVYTPYIDGAAQTAVTPGSTPNFAATGLWFGSDANSQYLDATFSYVMVVPGELSAAQMAAAMSKPNPWDDYPSYLVRGTLLGTDKNSAYATLATQNGASANPGLAVYDNSDYTFGPTAHGACVLPIA